MRRNSMMHSDELKQVRYSSHLARHFTKCKMARIENVTPPTLHSGKSKTRSDVVSYAFLWGPERMSQITSSKECNCRQERWNILCRPEQIHSGRCTRPYVDSHPYIVRCLHWLSYTDRRKNWWRPKIRIFRQRRRCSWHWAARAA